MIAILIIAFVGIIFVFAVSPCMMSSMDTREEEERTGELQE
jgi:NADH:ubiquinone oxidoreductase subunit 6 (subunit J)